MTGRRPEHQARAALTGRRRLEAEPPFQQKLGHDQPDAAGELLCNLPSTASAGHAGFMVSRRIW
jgi:hypothetical protein